MSSASDSHSHLDLMKKTFMIGLGAAVMTAEKVRDTVKDTVDELVARGVLKPNEAQQFADDLKKRMMSEKTTLDKILKDRVEGTLKQAIHALGLVTRKEMNEAVKKARQGKKSPAKPVAAKKPVVKAKKVLAKAVTANKKPIAKKVAAKKPAAKPAIRKKK